jgi:hypothetical protein
LRAKGLGGVRRGMGSAKKDFRGSGGAGTI